MDAFEERRILAEELPKSRANAGVTIEEFEKQKRIAAEWFARSRMGTGGTHRGSHAIMPTIEGFALVVRRCIDHLKEIDERYKTNTETRGDYREVLEVARALGIEV